MTTHGAGILQAYEPFDRTAFEGFANGSHEVAEPNQKA